MHVNETASFQKDDPTMVKATDKPEGSEDEKAEGTDLALQQQGATDLAVYEGYEADRGAGFENQTSEDISVPFIEVLQAQSPEVIAQDSSLKAGTFINRTTGEIWEGKEGVTFVPATTQHVVVEWVPRDKGGGIVATHELDSDLIREVRSSQPLGKYVHPENGNDLIETFYVYGMFVPGGDEAAYPAVIAFSSARIKPYKDWMFRARSIIINLPNGRKLTKLPLFSHRYRVKAVFQEKGPNKWYNLQVGFDGTNAEASRIAPNDELYVMCKQLSEDVGSGRKVADVASAGPAEAPDGAPRRGSTEQEDAPY